MSFFNQKNFLVCLLSVFFVLTVNLFFIRSEQKHATVAFQGQDASNYITLAHNLLSSGRWVNANSPVEHVFLFGVRMPLYPLYLASLLSYPQDFVKDKDSVYVNLTPGAAKRVVFISLWMPVLIAVLLFWIVLKLSQSVVASGAAVFLYGMDLLSQFEAISIMADTFYTATTFVGIFLLCYNFGRRHSILRYALAAVFLGLSALTRGNNLYLVAPAIVCIVWSCRADYWLKTIRNVFVFATIFCCIVALRYVQTAKVFERPTFGFQGFYLYGYKLPMMLELQDGQLFQQHCQQLDQTLQIKKQQLGLLQADLWAKQTTLNYAKDHPVIAIKMMGLSLLRFFTSAGRSDLGRTLYGKEPQELTNFALVTRPWLLFSGPVRWSNLFGSKGGMLEIALYSWTYTFVLLVLTLVGIFFYAKRCFEFMFPFTLMYSLVILSLCATETSLRMRAGFLPMFLVWAGLGSANLWNRFLWTLKK